MILFDFSQIIHNNIYSLKEDIIKKGLTENMQFLKHRIITHILHVANIYKQHSEIVLCADSKNNWRLDIHPHYKGRRKLRRVDDGFPWKEFWVHLNVFEKELIELFPFNFIKIDRAEGDDVIGTLVKYVHKTRPTEEIVIISNDKDFKQLHYDKRVKQYDHKQKKEIKTLNNINELMILALCGDSADDVLNVKTTDIDTFINPNKKQLTMWRTTKIWEHITNNTVKDELLVDIIRKNPKTKKNEVIVTKEQLLKNFERNMDLVDLRRIPVEIQKEILYEYERNYDLIPTKGSMPLLQYFIKQKMRVLVDRVDEFDKFVNFQNKNVDNGINEWLI